MQMARGVTNSNLIRLVDDVADLYGYAREAADGAVAIHEVEKYIWEQVVLLGRHVLEVFLESQGTGDLGEMIELPGNRQIRRLETLHPREYKSVFGKFTLMRAVYGSREGQAIEFVPLDARLQLPASSFSYLLQNWAQSLSVEHSFARTNVTLQRILGLGVCVDSQEQMSREMAASVEDFRQSRCAPPCGEEGKLLIVTADNKGIPMRRPADRAVAGSRRKKGEKANKKQMATIGCVYTVDPKVRTAHDLVEILFRENRPTDGRNNAEPTARHKRVMSSLSLDYDGETVRGEDIVFDWMGQEVLMRHRRGQKVACLMDGQKTLWEMRQTHLGELEMVEILDLLHVMTRIWDAAYLFHVEGSHAAVQFARERCLRLLRGEAGRVIGGLRQMATKHRLRGAKLKQLQAICRYLENNFERMHYDEYLAVGYPVASGVIEGACRYVIKDRMERSGMRWTPEGAQAMLDLRTTYINDMWDDFQAYRIGQERQRLYPQQKLLERVEWPIAA